MDNKPNKEAAPKRGKTNGYNSAKLHARRDKKRLEAEQRQLKYNSLSVQDKIAKLIKRRGKSKREHVKLTKLLEAA